MFNESESNTVSIIGIDPGSVNLGTASLTFDIDTYDIVSCDAITFNGEKLNGNIHTGILYGDRLQRIQRHHDNLVNLFRKVRPISVICESAFINVRRPAAYGALTEVICAIRQAVVDYDIQTPLYTVEPSNVKKAIGAPGNADKSIVKNFLLNNYQLTSTCVTPIEFLDEHSVDALCIAYAQYLRYRNN